MGHKTYISFKTEDKAYKTYIQENLDIDMIDNSLDEAIDSDDFEYIMRVIREQYLSDSTVTIFLIGERSNENLGSYEQRYIKRELQASLYHRQGNTQHGLLGIVFVAQKKFSPINTYYKIFFYWKKIKILAK